MCSLLLLRSSCLLVLTLACAHGARILFASGTPAYSHQIVFQPIWRELSLRGHQVTAITSNPLNDPALTNLTELNMGFIYEVMEKRLNFSETLIAVKDSPIQFTRFFLEMTSLVNQEYLAHPDVQRLIQSEKSQFDLVIIEFLLPTMLAFGHRFKCPTIAVTSIDASLVGHDSVGNPSHPALNPDSPLRFNVPLTFAQRVYSTLYSALRRIGFKFVKDKEDSVVEKYFAPGYPSLSKIVDNIDMFFMNVNPAFHNIRPTVPAVVHIGGSMHIKSPRSLPEDLKNFLDAGDEGVIFFSMGSVINTNTLSPHFMAALLGAFSELPYKVLWKLNQDIPGKPKNVLITNWVPQQDVLRHRNVKLFITPGGLQSIEEAINFRVPLLVAPYCSDHFSNALRVQDKGFGLVIDYHTVDKEMMKTAITEVINNSKYKEGVNKVADITADQPMTGLEKAVWWTEYVLRHKGAKHLRSPAVDMPLYQYFLLDVIAFLGLVIFLFLYLLFKCVCLTVRLLGFGRCCKLEKAKLKKN